MVPGVAENVFQGFVMRLLDFGSVKSDRGANSARSKGFLLRLQK